MPTSLGYTILYAAVIPNKDPSPSRPKDRQKGISRPLWITDAHTESAWRVGPCAKQALLRYQKCICAFAFALSA